MYQVMVVDDEPMAASLIVNIIKRKYSDFEIMGTAYDGEEALELMEEKGEPYKVELIGDLAEDAVISFYQQGDEWPEACGRNKKALSGSDQCHCQWISGIRICQTGYRIWGV